jgi:hypothetical protein
MSLTPLCIFLGRESISIKGDQTVKNATTKPTEENSDYLRPDGVCRYARISRRTLSDWQARRIIPFIKVSSKCVLFRKSDIDKALSRFEVSAVQ